MILSIIINFFLLTAVLVLVTFLLHFKQAARKKEIQIQRELKEKSAKSTQQLTYSAEKLDETGEELRKKVTQLSTLLEIGKALVSTLDLEKRIKLIVEKAVNIMNADVCSLRLLNEEKQELVSRGRYGLSKDHVKKGPLKIGESIAGRVVKFGKPIAVADLKKDKRMKFTDYIYQDGLCSLLSVPLISKEKSIGVITVYTKTIHKFTGEETALFSSFADHIVAAIENAQLYENIQRNYLATIRALALAVEARDHYTRGHSERVTQYAVKIAKQMRVSEEEIKTLLLAGRLHDIGKIAVSDVILRKPAKLTVAEMAEIKLHPVKGAEMLEPLEFLERCLPSIRHHHERFDGEGYPNGLKREEIPLLPRILAVADSFDAMTSERPYRGPLTTEEAIEEIKKNTGTQFDPEVVETFLKTLEKRG